MQTPASSPSEGESKAQEIILGDYTLKTQETGGRLVWENDTQTLRVNTKLFSSREAAQMTGLKALGLRMGMQSSLQDPHHQQIRQDISAQPGLQKLLQWHGLKLIGKKFNIPELDPPIQHLNSVEEFNTALAVYSLTSSLPQTISASVSSVLNELNEDFEKKGGSLNDFLFNNLLNRNIIWSNKLTDAPEIQNLSGRRELWEYFIAPALQKLKEIDKQTGKTEGFQYQPPQSSSLSEDQEELPEDAILTKVGPKFLGGYYRRRRCYFNPQQKNGIGQDALPKAQWIPSPPPDLENPWETKRPYAGTFTPGQENRLPWNKDALPLLETLQPANTFVLMRDSQGGVSIEAKEGVKITKPTPFGFDFVLHACEDNRMNDEPTDRDKKIEGGDLDPDMQLFLDDLDKSGYNDVRKGQEVVRYIRAHFRYPNDSDEIAQIDGIYQPLLQSNVQGLWQRMNEVGVMHCYWANILRNELCHRLEIASAICEGPYVQKDPRWNFAVVEAPGLTEHAWGIVWDPDKKEWTHDGQDATPPKEKSDNEEPDTEEDSEPQDGDFGPTDPPDQRNEEELKELYESFENDQDDQAEEDQEPTPEERAAEQFLREKGIEKSTWDAFVRKTENWGRQLVPAQNSIDGRESTLEQEDRKLTELIKIRRQILQTKFKGPVRQSEGTFLDEPVTAYLGSKSGDPDPIGWKNLQTHIREKVEVTVFEQDFIADLSGSMDSSGAVNPQHQMILQSLYYDWRRNQHLSHSQNREDMTTPLEWKSQVYSFGGFASNDLGVNDELNEKKLCQLDQTLQEADGSSSAGMYQTLQAYKDSLTDEDKKLLKESKKIKMLTITTDGDIPDQGNCKKLVQELRELGVVVQGIGFGSGASNIHEVCREAGDETSSVVLGDITQATQARSQKLKKVIQEQL